MYGIILWIEYLAIVLLHVCVYGILLYRYWYLLWYIKVLCTIVYFVASLVSCLYIFTLFMRKLAFIDVFEKIMETSFNQ